MKSALCAAALLILFPFIPAAAGKAHAAPFSVAAISVSASSPEQGDPVLVEAETAPHADSALLTWKGREIPMKPAGGGRFVALVGIDLADPPGTAVLTVAAVRGVERSGSSLELTVLERKFPVQELKLPREMAEFDPATLDRIRIESERLDKLFSAVTVPAWDFPFIPPVEDFRPTGFGARRIINGEPRSPHAAVDVHLPAGTPVAAIAAGTVAFAGEQFFGGRSVVLDHGGGLFSLYYHLKEYCVEDGMRVAKGGKIGAVGSSGRATGPHLHFGVRAPGGRIDPARLFGQSFR